LRFKKTEPKNFISVLLIIIAVSLLVSGLCSCGFKTLERFEETREMMGTYVTIIIYADEDDYAEVMDAAYNRIQQVVDVASVYDENSEISVLNREGYIDNPSRELKELIELSIKYYEISGGCFDITVSPVLKLWSGGLWKESEQVQAEKIEEALKLVGSDMIILEDDRIYYKTEGMSADLGGIAKGYAVDEALKVISEHGIKHALVNAGGDVATIGKKASGEKWVIELDDPERKESEDTLLEELPTFEFEDGAVATSGNYYRYYDPEGEVHHITDPLTGYSADKCISVTIITDTCTRADVLATSVFVMGVSDGMELVESLDGAEALIIDNDRNIYSSSGLLKYIK
jgi:FAD:protein FMN transferase